MGCFWGGLAALEAGVPWNWRTTGEYLAAVEATEPVVNLGFMVGHSAIRRVVMGEDAVGAVADARQVEAMRGLLRDGLAAGGFGFSSSWSTSHWDGEGAPVPSRSAAADELVSLCAVLADFPGTQVEFLPTNDDFTDVHLELMTRMALTSGRPLNWNVYIPRGNQRDESARKLSASDHARARGAQVFALTYPDVIRARMTFLGAGVDPMPGWAAVMALPVAEKLAALQDPDVRARLAVGAQSPEAGNYRETVARWADMVVDETFAPQHRGYEGRSLGDIGRERDQDPFDALLDIVVADELRTGLTPIPPAADADSWALRIESWTRSPCRHRRVGRRRPPRPSRHLRLGAPVPGPGPRPRRPLPRGGDPPGHRGSGRPLRAQRSRPYRDWCDGRPRRARPGAHRRRSGRMAGRSPRRGGSVVRRAHGYRARAGIRHRGGASE